jgi:hypothetical protein
VPGKEDSFNAADWIYKFKIQFTVGGTEYPVATVTTDQSHNSIPAVSLVIDPLRADGGGVDDITPKSSSIFDLLNLHDQLQKKANSGTEKIVLDVKAISVADTQSIFIENWVMSGVAIEGLQSRGYFAVVVTLVHPTHRATSASASIQNQSNLTKDPNINPDNPLSTYLEAAGKFANVSSPPTDDTGTAFDNSGRVAEILSGRLRDSVTLLGETVVWNRCGQDASDLPYSKSEVDDEARERLIKTFNCFLGHYFYMFTQGNNTSPWQSLSQSITADMDLCISGAISDNPLKLIPLAPWGASSGDIFEDEIFDLTSVPREIEPMSGVVALYPSALIDQQGNWAAAGGFSKNLSTAYQNTISVSELSSVGEFLTPAVKDNNDAAGSRKPLIGRIDERYPPNYLLSYLQQGANCDGGTNSGLGSISSSRWAKDMFDANGNTKIPSPQTMMTQIRDYRGLINLWCKQVFFRNFRRDLNISIGVRLMVHSEGLPKLPGGVLRPGVTLGIRSRDKDTAGFFFYVTRVLHYIDAQKGMAYTNIMGAYVRPASGVEAAGITADDVINGIKNPIWNSDGVLGPNDVSVEVNFGGSDDDGKRRFSKTVTNLDGTQV